MFVPSQILSFYFVSGCSQLRTLPWFQMNSEGTQPYAYTYLFSPKLPSHPGCHVTWAEFPVLHRGPLMLIHWKHSRAYMPSKLPNRPFPHSHKFVF